MAHQQIRPQIRQIHGEEIRSAGTVVVFFTFGVLGFTKCVQPNLRCSVRVDLDWRAVGVMEGDTVISFFVGPHSEYEKLLDKM
jgi:hypothetical protein